MSGSFPFPAPPFPAPARLRLVSRVAVAGLRARLRPPLGVTQWSDDEASDVAIVLDGRAAMTLADVASQLPAPADLPEGALLIILPNVAPVDGPLRRWLFPRAMVPRADRSGALLARGFERLGGGLATSSGGDLAWGYAPLRRASGGARASAVVELGGDSAHEPDDRQRQ